MADFNASTSNKVYNSTIYLDSTVSLGSSGGPGPIDNYIHFPSVTIPKGVTILSAIITFTSWNSDSSTSPHLIIQGNDEDDSVTPSNTTEFAALVKTTAQVTWESLPAWVADNEYSTPSIISVIQEIIDRAGWVSGNDIGIIILDNGDTTTGRLRIAKGGTWGTGKPKLTVTYEDYLDVANIEGISFSEGVISWYNPERIEEGIEFNDSIIGFREWVLSIAEDITFAETIGFLMTYTKDISDSFNLAETLNIEQLDDLTEGLSLADVLQCPYWSETLSEAFSALDIAQVENRNVTWRQEKSLNMVGQHIQLKFYNNTLDQSLYLRDIKMYFDRWEDRKAIEAGDYVGEHVRITFRNNVVDESLYLEYVRIIGIFRGLLGWSV